MASSAATSSLSHAMPPPFVLPAPPRIRPPRMLPGTKSPNSDPQPEGSVPDNQVWVQGRWRNPASQAARNESRVLSAKVERAVRARRHGSSIYAYSNIRTNQVVYSLTKIMRNNQVLKQLVFHGKKTIPESLRRDVWTPYWSVHFPNTISGASQAGLIAYQRLRELSLQRQLAPPEDMIMTTEADLEKAKGKYDPVDFAEGMRRHVLQSKLPILGQMLPKKLRAKKVMDQRASSVADLALVLGLMEGEDGKFDFEQLDEQMRERWALRGSTKSKKFKTRMRALRAKVKAMEVEREQIADMIARVGRSSGQVGLEGYAAKRIAMTEGGLVQKEAQNGQPRHWRDVVDVEREPLVEKTTFDVKLAEVKRWLDADVDEEAQEAVSQPEGRGSTVIKVLWADIADGQLAQEWPGDVVHGQLEKKAVARDSAGRQIAASVHQMATEQGTSSYETPSQLKERREAERLTKLEEHKNREVEWRLDQALTFKERGLDLELELQDTLQRLSDNSIDLQIATADLQKTTDALYAKLQQLLEDLSRREKMKFMENSEGAGVGTDQDAVFAEYEDVKTYLASKVALRIENAGKAFEEMRATGGPRDEVGPPAGLGQPAVKRLPDRFRPRWRPVLLLKSMVKGTEIHKDVQPLYEDFPELEQVATTIYELQKDNIYRIREIEDVKTTFVVKRKEVTEELRAKVAHLRTQGKEVPRDVEAALLREAEHNLTSERDEKIKQLRSAIREDKNAILDQYAGLIREEGQAGTLSQLQALDPRFKPVSKTEPFAAFDPEIVPPPSGIFARIRHELTARFGRGSRQ